MKVTYNWLKDFVDIKISPHLLADKLTMAGLEVTALEEHDGDFVLEIEVTPNRPDCLSVIGIAREVAAITNSKLKAQNSKLRAPNLKGGYPLKIEIQDKKDCPLYTAKIIKDVKVGPSPDWLKMRLELVGCHSVNNVVDITNYILFTWGEPLHAFDLDTLVNQSASYPVSQLANIIVRRAQEKEELVTIDGIKRELNKNTLIIASNKTGKPANRQTGKPIAIAGIMGGKDTEVGYNTKNILLEAAIFNPIIIRRGRQKLGMQTDSSYRFERGVDLETVEKAAWQAASLIQKICNGQYVLAKSSGLTKLAKKEIDFDVSSVHKILGVNIAVPKIKNILNQLAFKVKPKVRRKKTRQSLWRAKNKFKVEVPGHRGDVNLEIDLIEEIARLYGYARISTTLPKVSPRINASGKRALVSAIKNILLGLGLDEVITYSLIDKDLLGDCKTQGFNPIEISNPLSKEQEILRPTLFPSLARCVAVNLNQKQDRINIFEIAPAFFGTGIPPREELALGIALCGIKPRLLEQGLIKDEVGLLHLKGILVVLFARLGIKGYSFDMPDSADAAVVRVQEEKIGVMEKLQKSILDRLDIKNKDVLVAEISLDKLLSYADLKKKFVHPAVYPGISRDVSIILQEKILAENILEAVREKAGGLLREVEVVDYYKGKQIPSGFKGITLSCFYRADERTLTEAEVNPIQASVVNTLKDRFGAQIR